MIKGMYMGEQFAYDGTIESVGEYLSSRREGDKVWMGRTEYGFVYACYGDGQEPLVLATFCPDDMLRFTSPYKSTEKENITWSKSIPIPQVCVGAIALRAEELRLDSQELGRKIEYNSDYVKKMVESL